MSSVDHLKDCREFYMEFLHARFGDPLGATAKSVSDLEQELGFMLPESYRQFLLWMGSDKDGVLKGSEWFIDDILSNNEFLDEFLADNGVAEAVPSHTVCFFVHQGYMAAWFVDVAASDPACSFYSEVNLEPVVVGAGSFSSFLLKELQAVAEAAI